MTLRRLTMTLTVGAMMLGAMAPAVFAKGATDQAQKAGSGWGCGGDGGALEGMLPAGHCINPANTRSLLAGTLPKTFQLQVFDESGNFVTAEIATVKTSADGRACPHDEESPDGTYWDFLEDFLYVCHHRSE